MFYDVDLYNLKSRGEYSLIWLAAQNLTRFKKLISIEEINALNVEKICCSLIRRICTTSSNPKDHLALRQSALLILGVVRVFAQQVLKVYTTTLTFSFEIKKFKNCSFVFDEEAEIPTTRDGSPNKLSCCNDSFLQELEADDSFDLADAISVAFSDVNLPDRRNITIQERFPENDFDIISSMDCEFDRINGKELEDMLADWDIPGNVLPTKVRTKSVDSRTTDQIYKNNLTFNVDEYENQIVESGDIINRTPNRISLKTLSNKSVKKRKKELSPKIRFYPQRRKSIRHKNQINKSHIGSPLRDYWKHQQVKFNKILDKSIVAVEKKSSVKCPVVCSRKHFSRISAKYLMNGFSRNSKSTQRFSNRFVTQPVSDDDQYYDVQLQTSMTIFRNLTDNANTFNDSLYGNNEDNSSRMQLSTIIEETSSLMQSSYDPSRTKTILSRDLESIVEISGEGLKTQDLNCENLENVPLILKESISETEKRAAIMSYSANAKRPKLTSRNEKSSYLNFSRKRQSSPSISLESTTDDMFSDDMSLDEDDFIESPSIEKRIKISTNTFRIENEMSSIPQDKTFDINRTPVNPNVDRLDIFLETLNFKTGDSKLENDFGKKAIIFKLLMFWNREYSSIGMKELLDGVNSRISAAYTFHTLLELRAMKLVDLGYSSVEGNQISHIGKGSVLQNYFRNLK